MTDVSVDKTDRLTVYIRETELSGVSVDGHLQQTHQSHNSTTQQMDLVATYAHYTHSNVVKIFISRLR